MVALALGLHRSTLYRLRDRGVSSSVEESVIDEQLAFRVRGILDQEEAFGQRGFGRIFVSRKGHVLTSRRFIG